MDEENTYDNYLFSVTKSVLMSLEKKIEIISRYEIYLPVNFQATELAKELAMKMIEVIDNYNRVEVAELIFDDEINENNQMESEEIPSQEKSSQCFKSYSSGISFFIFKTQKSYR